MSKKTTTPHRRTLRKRPPATRRERAFGPGGLPDTDIDCITMVASASAEHGWPDMIEAVARMPALVRWRIGELLLNIAQCQTDERDRVQRAADAERELALNALVVHHGKVRLLVKAVIEGGETRELAHALVMNPEELAAWRDRSPTTKLLDELGELSPGIANLAERLAANLASKGRAA